ncbi:hypothetical protein AVEN_173776-1 [Araneus ventricosus]|uniref:Uncharacterized protein n=1 Tax=Araneus ventricosus TaxID=182803 RepID=A0A4Y2TI47_ARAVE|nr:hypothetical protein AVEN_161977-1 [Araneus ventricosus]GBN99680.1 hypothetical protein AVEN_264970-1 [Araneus ventricosus]GBN99710.1 hypothetical protein AVEN_4619-1 [Araneus ventricosus]GBO00106.1 hypothetical protein AVEN_173776-1 [Araneus ventricosus]
MLVLLWGGCSPIAPPLDSPLVCCHFIRILLSNPSSKLPLLQSQHEDFTQKCFVPLINGTRAAQRAHGERRLSFPEFVYSLGTPGMEKRSRCGLFQMPSDAQAQGHCYHSVSTCGVLQERHKPHVRLFRLFFMGHSRF